MQYKKKEISEKILEAGRNEYAEKGFRAGNISVIAASAGVPVGNLYRYFDGKSGLLNAIVKPAYTQIPKLITQLSEMDEDGKMSIEQFAPLLTQKFMDIINKFGKEILILMDKCESTRYEDFSIKLVAQVNQLMLNKLFKSPSESDKVMSQIISKAFIGSIFDVLKLEADAQRLEGIFNKILVFYFLNVKERC